MEIVKLRLQSAETSLTPFEAINELGLRDLYKGSAVTLARDIPYNVLFFLSYIYLKRGLTDQEGNISREKSSARELLLEWWRHAPARHSTFSSRESKREVACIRMVQWIALGDFMQRVDRASFSGVLCLEWRWH